MVHLASSGKPTARCDVTSRRRPVARATIRNRPPTSQPVHSQLSMQMVSSGPACRIATQTIGADSVDAVDAALLGVPPSSPVLRCQRITTDVQGRPVLMSEYVFPAHRTEFVVELPTAEPSGTPSGLRLVE